MGQREHGAGAEGQSGQPGGCLVPGLPAPHTPQAVGPWHSCSACLWPPGLHFCTPLYSGLPGLYWGTPETCLSFAPSLQQVGKDWLGPRSPLGGRWQDPDSLHRLYVWHPDSLILVKLLTNQPLLRA